MSSVRIVSCSEEPFSGRMEAGRLLAGELARFRGKDAIVLGIPRGGIVIAKEISSALDARLDIVLSHKLGAPANAELAIGAIAEGGKIFLNEKITSGLDVQSAYLKQEQARQLAVIKRRVEQYRGILAKTPLKDRIVIITDDGVATGATMKAALWAARQEQPKMLIAALPVGPQDTIREISQDADEVLCLRCPSFFGAIGQFYLDFSQVEDGEVLEILKKERKARDEHP